MTDEIKKENIWHIYESAFKMGSFIDETLLWIQIRNGEVEAQKSTFAIHDLFVDSIKLVQKDPKILEGQVQIRISCDSTLQITSDPILIATVMRNLVSNSINYSASGTVTLFAEKGRNGNVVFGCGDEGKGMDPELISVLLSEEYRGNSIRKDSFRMGYVNHQGNCTIDWRKSLHSIKSPARKYGFAFLADGRRRYRPLKLNFKALVHSIWQVPELRAYFLRPVFLRS